MATQQSRVVLITGASSGIGRAVARRFAARGDRVVLSGRSVSRLDALADEIRASGGNAWVLPADLSVLAEAEALVGRAIEACGRIDVLVNNAGFGMQCRFGEMGTEDIVRMFTVNVLSCMALARAAVAAMWPQGGGHIVNVASVGGLVAHPLNVAYCASKHALVGFSKSLRLELAGTGIRVTVVCPGGTRTEFFERAQADIPFAPEFERYLVSPEKVAAAIVQAADGVRAVVFPSFTAWLLAAVDKWFPRLSARGNVRYRDRVLALTAPTPAQVGSTGRSGMPSSKI